MKRMITCFALLLAILATHNVAMAAEPLAFIDGQESKLDQVIGFYNQGTTPTAEDVLGNWSGRSFFKDTPNAPGGSYLVCEMHREDLGPLFPEENLGCYTSSYLDSKPDHYDSGANISKDYARLELKKVVVATTDNGLCYDTHTQSYGDEYKGLLCLKKYNDYIVYVSMKGDTVLFGGYFYIKHP